MKRLIMALLFAAVITPTLAVAQAAMCYDYYVVYVDKLNMRAAPGTSADVVAVLARGTRLAPTARFGEKAEGRYWVPMRLDDKTGWVAEEYLVSDVVYDAFAAADAAGRTGDAGRMMEEIRLACDKSEWPEYRLNVSPDGRKVVCAAYGPALYFEAGKGLAFNLGDTWTAGGPSEWTEDSHYLAYYVVPEVTSPVIVYDTVEGEIVGVAGRAAEYYFVAGYFVWSTYEERGPLPEGPDYDGFVPVVMAMELATGEELRLLVPDESTLRPEDGEYELKMVEADEAPPEVAASPLYEKYLGKYVWWQSGQ